MSKTSDTILPLKLLSTEEAERTLKITMPKAKQISDQVISSFAELPVYLKTTDSSDMETNKIMREGIAKAVLSPHLRANILLVFNDKGTGMYLHEVPEQELSGNELRAIMLCAYESLKGNDNRKFMIPYRELNQTHMVHGSSFSKYLINKDRDVENSEVVVINVHHDYIRGYASLVNEELILRVCYELNDQLLNGIQKDEVLEVE